MQEGIDSEAAFKLLEAAAGFIASEYGVVLSCRRLVSAQPRPTTIEAVLNGIEDVTKLHQQDLSTAAWRNSRSLISNQPMPDSTHDNSEEGDILSLLR
ncbi:hypothetical protein CHELA1G11_21090 [Hyphomicrobiales bacterium]|nr:hypothetical protein CHELA1G11_21090 [Hyphomicrobiales bacterium]CAH1693258.1 hypothetical protein CHELA1G2_21398 [Hyphomicrobiales bacterium]